MRRRKTQERTEARNKEQKELSADSKVAYHSNSATMWPSLSRIWNLQFQNGGSSSVRTIVKSILICSLSFSLILC